MTTSPVLLSTLPLLSHVGYRKLLAVIILPFSALQVFSCSSRHPPLNPCPSSKFSVTLWNSSHFLPWEVRCTPLNSVLHHLSHCAVESNFIWVWLQCDHVRLKSESNYIWRFPRKVWSYWELALLHSAVPNVPSSGSSGDLRFTDEGNIKEVMTGRKF